MRRLRVLIATIGTFVYGTSPSVWVVLLGIVLFSLGEMLNGFATALVA